MPSVWQRLADIVGSVGDRTGVAGSLANLLDPDNWLPGGRDAAFTLALIALSAKMAVADGVATASESRAFKRTVELSSSSIRPPRNSNSSCTTLRSLTSGAPRKITSSLVSSEAMMHLVT